MIFSCFPPQGKCEWSHLKVFVGHYNSIYGKSYTRSECLDVEKRNTKEPELLLEAPGEIRIVVEHKSVIWPPKHMSDHSNEHYLCERICHLLGDQFKDSVYQLIVNAGSLKGKRKREVGGLAEQIAQVVLSNETKAKSQRGIGDLKPTPWRFRSLSPYEKNETVPETGIGLKVRLPLETFQSVEIAKSGYGEEFERLATDAAEKFVDYADHLRLLLVQFYGDSSFTLGDEDVIEIIQSAQVPEIIDQVWLAQQNWVGENDYEIAWERVR